MSRSPRYVNVIDEFLTMRSISSGDKAGKPLSHIVNIADGSPSALCGFKPINGWDPTKRRHDINNVECQRCKQLLNKLEEKKQSLPLKDRILKQVFRRTDQSSHP